MNTLRILIIATTVALLSASSCKGQELQMNMSVKDALTQRHSVRSYTSQAITEKTVLEILWAANGVNREDGRRTAPSAVNARDIDLYVCKEDGTFKYDAAAGKILEVTGEDIRPLLKAQNRFVDQAPVTILLVTDQTRFGDPRPGSRNMNFGFIDAGIVSENISLYCTAIGLGTVCCAPRMRIEEIQKVLGLSDQQIPVLYHPIGYPKE